jgi:hypothetical protein
MAGTISLKTKRKAKERPKKMRSLQEPKKGEIPAKPLRNRVPPQLRLMFSSCLRQGAHISGISCSTGFT